MVLIINKYNTIKYYADHPQRINNNAHIDFMIKKK